MPPLVTLFWILKKAKAMPKMTCMMVRAAMPWAASWLRPRLKSPPRIPVTPAASAPGPSVVRFQPAPYLPLAKMPTPARRRGR
jgi:hypothetical protein